MFDQAIADQVCERIANGEPLAQICRNSERMPSVTTLWNWTQENRSFAESIARARAIGCDVIADDCLRIADTPVEGIRTKQTPDGTETWTEDMLGHRKLQVETRLRLLSKWHPKKYGDRLQSDIDLAVTVTVVNPFQIAQDVAQAMIASQPAIEQDK